MIGLPSVLTQMSDDPLDNARADLRARLGQGARRDSPAAPHSALSSMRLARAGCTREMTLIDDANLQSLEAASAVADVGCLARLIAVEIERLVGHAGLEGGGSEDKTDLTTEIFNTINLPGRAIRALYLHALQHLDVALRDLDGPGWRAPLALSVAGIVTPEAAVETMTRALHTCRGHLERRRIVSTHQSNS